MGGDKKLSDRLAALGFCALLAMPLAGHLFSGGGDVSDLERRKRAEPPSLAAVAAHPAGAPAAVNAWLNDRFGFRSALIRLDFDLKNRLDLTDERRGVRGDNGWLFNNVENSLKMHQGFFPFAPGERDAWLEGAADIRAAACGAPFIALLAPNKHTIYPEHLSAYPRRINDPTRLEALEEADGSMGLAIVSPRRKLLEIKKEGLVYFRKDTHWTPFGAYAAYRMAMDGFAEQGLDAVVVTEDRLNAQAMTRGTNDLYGLVGLAPEGDELAPAYAVKNARRLESDVYTPAYDQPGFPAHRMTMEGAKKPSLLIYGDSFVHVMMPYLKESFGDITLIHHHNGAPPLEIAASCGYDAVMLQVVERVLTHPMEPAPARRH